MEVITPRGELAGYFELSQPGVLGYTHVYGAEGETGGFLEGELLTFRVNGLPAAEGEPLYWSNDYELHALQLSLISHSIYIPSLMR